MAIPDYQTIMLPLLQFAGDGKVHSKREAVDSLASEFSLTDEERRELLPSGKQGLLDNRVAWAKSYLKQARLIGTPKRGHELSRRLQKKFQARTQASLD